MLLRSESTLKIVTPTYFKETSKEEDEAVGGDLYKDQGQSGFDIAIDHFGIFLPNHVGFIYELDNDVPSPRIQIENFDFICTTGSGPCVVICAEVTIDTKQYQALAHVSSLHNLNDVLEQLYDQLILHNKALMDVPVQFYLFGGTANSINEFLAEEEISPPSEDSFVDCYPRVVNEEDGDNLSILMHPSQITIWSYDANFKIKNCYEQVYDPEVDPIALKTGKSEIRATSTITTPNPVAAKTSIQDPSPLKSTLFLSKKSDDNFSKEPESQEKKVKAVRDKGEEDEGKVKRSKI